MNVSLTPELDKYVHGKVATGRYSSASEVVREALRTMQEREIDFLVDREVLRKKIDAGLDALERGDYVDATGDEHLRTTLESARMRHGL
ncbi:MAG: type II toxin-antitoxin system ParD family antitoxin [Chlorobia bacterium]|nr:type II toxin-antitoxin system ParD family antitoxin [Fimbriimonadaceae bacterium]